MRAGARRTAHNSTGDAMIIHSNARRYHSGDDIQPASHCEPRGSESGTIHHTRLRQGTRVVAECVTWSATAIAPKATAANSHSGKSNRRVRSRSVAT